MIYANLNFVVFLCFCVLSYTCGAANNRNDNILEISEIKFCLLELQLLPETFYSTHNNESSIYQIYTKIGLKNESGKTKKLKWEYTVRWDGPMDIELKPASTHAKEVTRKGYPFGDNCCPEYKKLNNKQTHILKNLSEAFYIENIDSEYIINIRGKITINNIEKEYTFNTRKNLKQILNSDFWNKKVLH